MFLTAAVAAAAPCVLLKSLTQNTQCSFQRFTATPDTPAVLTNSDATVHVEIEFKCTGNADHNSTATLFATEAFAIPNAALAPNAHAAAEAGTYCQSFAASVSGTFPTLTVTADVVLAPWAVTGWAGVAALVGVQFPFTPQGQYVAVDPTAAVAAFSGDNTVTPADATTGTLTFSMLMPPVRNDARLDADWVAFKLVAGLQADAAAKRGDPAADVIAAVGKLTPYAVRLTSVAFGGMTPTSPSLLDVLRSTASIKMFAELLPLCAPDVLANITAVGGTAFAPEDAAFAAANITNATAWAEAHPAACAALLRDHYLTTPFVTSLLPVGGTVRMESQGSRALYAITTLHIEQASLSLAVSSSSSGGAAVEFPDLVARNGVVQAVKAFVFPPSDRVTAASAVIVSDAAVRASRRGGAPLAPQSTAAVAVQFVWPGPAPVPAGWGDMVSQAGAYAAARLGDNGSATATNIRVDPSGPAPAWNGVQDSESRPAYALWMGVVITVVSVLVFLAIAVRTFRQRATFE